MFRVKCDFASSFGAELMFACLVEGGWQTDWLPCTIPMDSQSACCMVHMLLSTLLLLLQHMSTMASSAWQELLARAL